MAVVTMRQLLEAGVHFGHQTRRWNPKMKRFIFGERNGIYIIDLNQTLERIDVAYSFVRDLVADNGSVLFVGTKKQTQDPVARYAAQCGMPYINERWLGGMLTNFSTIAGRVKKMQEYERMREAGDFEAMPKKEALILSRELDKLQRNLGGIRGMSRLPEAVFIIDTKKEHIAVTEANKLNIPIVAVVDTNCDPDLIDFVIPGNDDAIRAGTLMCRIIADAVEEGRFIASRRAARSGTQAAGPAVLDPEEEARRAEQQREARRQAAIAQAEREARLSGGGGAVEAATADSEVASEVDSEGAPQDGAPQEGAPQGGGSQESGEPQAGGASQAAGEPLAGGEPQAGGASQAAGESTPATAEAESEAPQTTTAETASTEE
jgi:small subunit ribosomal protein S2